MEVTPESVKAWLAKHPDRDRHWLAERCEADKRTVDNWLSSPRGIPLRAAVIIEKLMEEDAQAEEEKRRKNLPGPQLFSVEVDLETFRSYSQAARDAGLTLEEWAIKACDEEVERLLRGEADPLIPFPDSSSAPMTTLRFLGLAAAGVPGGAIDELTDDTVTVPGTYPADHFALRVHGPSMEPDYPDGSIIVCRPLKSGQFATKGQDVIASDANGTYFKRLIYTKEGQPGDTPRRSVPRLVSINPDFPEVTPLTECPIRAVVVGVVTPVAP